MGGKRRAGTGAIELRLLGSFEALEGGRQVAVGGPKPKALLALLATEAGRVVSIDRLVEELWPGRPPDTATHAIQVYVSQLRKTLGDAIAREGPGYVLRLDPERIDVHRFERLAAEGHEELAGESPAAAAGTLREALALWRGPALADFAYEPFAQAEIARLEELRTVVLEERIEADLALGRHAELVSELEALVQSQPLRERPRAQLMLALYRSGRQADALAAYRAARDTLVGELGIDPGPELRSLEAAILRQDESLLLEETPLARPAMQFRRLATILFVDVVDSMAVAEALDAEALGSLQRRYFQTVSAALVRHGGTVEKYAGDAVMAVFGVPVAHEDDALRAARAAFDILAGVAALDAEVAKAHGLGLQVRIGLAAGEVVAASTESRQRFVAGDVVGVAARLHHEAGPGEIVVGDLVARLIDHAARLEPLGTLEVKSRKTPIEMLRLLELAPAASTFEQRLDAPLVGRKKELAALRKALKRAVDEGRPRVVTVVGSAGVGKSRLASELMRRTRGIRALRGRCLSYGEGITYWPLREIVEQASPGEEREAVVAALDAETPPPAAEVALLFRQLCAALAREKPLVLVLDDVHWAEPTMLELVEHLADRGEGPLLVVCLAREELLESRPDFLADRASCQRLELDPLAEVETEALLDALGGTVLEPDQRSRIAETAEGNPLFVEQLLALAAEGGLAEGALPPTVQALLAARLDRLGPGERAVLERGAVVGKEFTAEDVVALLDPHAAPTAEAHLRSLSARGFVRPHDGGAFRFRHVLVQEAVYRSAPKRLRAELHERFADRLDEAYPDLPDLDEFVGYHLEQAFKLRTELGESDRRTAQLAEDAGRRLGEAGVRASKRADVPASIGLLVRATSVLPSDQPLHAEFLCELGIAQAASGAADAACRTIERAIEEAVATGGRKIELQARMELAYTRLPHSPGLVADDLLETATAAVPVLEAAGDYRWLGRALLLAGWVQGGRRGHHKAREEAAERALSYYMRSTWPISTPAGEIANALYYGPTPIPVALGRCEELLTIDTITRYGQAHVQVYRGGLVAQQGDFEQARALISSARATYEELGDRMSAATFGAAVQADVELLEGQPGAAETTLRWLCQELLETRAYSRLASRAGDLADVLYQQDKVDEASEWVALAERHSAHDDVDARTLWMPVKAKIAARRGQLPSAIEIGVAAVELAALGDALNRTAKANEDLAEVCRIANRDEAAESASSNALALYEQKGNVVAAARARQSLDDRALV